MTTMWKERRCIVTYSRRTDIQYLFIVVLLVTVYIGPTLCESKQKQYTISTKQNEKSIFIVKKKSIGANKRNLTFEIIDNCEPIEDLHGEATFVFTDLGTMADIKEV